MRRASPLICLAVCDVVDVSGAHRRRGEAARVSGPKARCPSCGTEWDGPVVFCGECGSPVAPNALGDCSARLPPRATTFVGALPGIPVGPGAAPLPPVPGGDASGRHTVLGMTAVTPPPPQETTTLVSSYSFTEPKPSGGGKKGRRGSSTAESAVDTGPPSKIVVELPRAAPASQETPRIEVSPFSEIEEHDAGWTTEPDSPAAAPVPAAPPPRTPPEAVPEVVAAPAPAVSTEPVVENVVPAPAEMPPFEPEDTQRLLDDLDAGFESIVRPSMPLNPSAWVATPDDVRWTPEPPASAEPGPQTLGARAARHEADMAEVRELFAGIAVAYARPLRDFMIEVAWGEPTREWLDVAVPAALALRRAATAVELPEVDAALEGYGTALELAAGEASLNREVREMLAGAYARLVEAMPGVFALEGERGRREPIIVRSLLLQVPGVRRVAIDKLYAAGINSLEILYAARPRELAEATGLDFATAAGICDRFQSYRREVGELSPGKNRERERVEIEELTADSARHHEAHERAAASWAADAAARRAEARKERADTALRIDVLLAHLGEVDLLNALAKLPFQQKIRELQRYLEEAKQKAAAASRL